MSPWLVGLLMLPRYTVASSSVRPPVTVAGRRERARSRSLSNVTPASVPRELVKVSSAPPASVTVPPSTVPPTTFHEPVAAVKASVMPTLFRVPVRFTVPPERVNEPRPATVKVPPRLTVVLVAVIVPSFDQVLFELPRLSVEPVAVMVEPAALLHVPSRLSDLPGACGQPLIDHVVGAADAQAAAGAADRHRPRLPVSPPMLSDSPFSTAREPWLVKVAGVDRDRAAGQRRRS